MSTAVSSSAIDACHAQGPRWRDCLLALAGILILSDAFDALLYRGFGRFAELLPGVPMSRALLLPVFVASALLLAGDLRGAAQYVRAAWPLWPALVLACVSTTWSDVPRTTLLWSAALLGTSAFGVALATRFSPRLQSELVAAAVAAVALPSIVIALCWPAFGISRRRELRGLMLQQELTRPEYGAGYRRGRRRRDRRTASRRRRRRAAPVRGADPAVAVACVAVRGRRGAHGDRPAARRAHVAAPGHRHSCRRCRGDGARSNVSARHQDGSDIGGAQRHLQRPNQDLARGHRAHGADAVAGARLRCVLAGTGWSRSAEGLHPAVGHAHNGFVDCYAELGIVGLALVCLPLIVFSAGAFRHAWQPGARACIWPAAFLLFFIASNVAESSLLRHKLGWALYVAVACHLAGGRRSVGAGVAGVG